MAYTTSSLVGDEVLQTIDNNSTPSSTTVTTWITEAEDQIDELTGTRFESTTVTDAIIPFISDNAFSDQQHNFWFAAARQATLGLTQNAFFLQDVNGGPQRRPIISITSLAVNGAPPSSADSFTALTENTGSGGSYITDKETGKTVFISDFPLFGHPRAIKTTFAYGYASVPLRVQELTTKMVAKRVIQAKANASQFTNIDSYTLEGISRSKSINQTAAFLKSLQIEIDSLTSKVVGTYRIDVAQ